MALEPLYADSTTNKQAKTAGWKRVGELEDGRPIWEETVEVVVGKKPLIVNGVQQYVKVGGEIIKEKTVSVREMQTRRFVEEKQPNGGVFKNYTFEPDPEERARLEKKDKKRRFMEELADRAVENDLDVDSLIAAVSSGESATPRRRR